MNEEHVRKRYNSLASLYDSRWKGYLESTHGRVMQLATPHPHDTILDASGGTGLLAERMIQTMGEKATITLVDLSEEMLGVAARRLKKYRNVHLLMNDVHDLRFNPGSFSMVVSVSALHHYADPAEAVSQFYRVLQPGGSLIIVDWCRDSFHFKAYDVFLGLKDKDHSRIHSKRELKELLISKGFSIDNVMKWSYGLWRFVGVKALKKGKE